MPPMQQSDELFRLLVESVRDYAIFALGPAGRVITWNTGAERIKGYTADDIIGRHFSIFYPAEDIARGKPDAELEIARSLGRVEDEGWRLRKDGTRFWANVVITALRDHDGELQGFVKVTRDLTERRRAEESRERFIADAAHEMRTPVTTVAGFAELLQRRRDLPEESLEQVIDGLRRGTRRLATLIDDLLDLTRLEQGHTELSIAPVDLPEVVDSALAALPPGVRPAVAIGALDGYSVQADHSGLERVVLNLLSNAGRHGLPPVRLDAARDGGAVKITVSDGGPGVDPDLLPHLFEPFSRGRNTGSEVGSGLGLSIVRRLVEAFGGNVAYAADPSRFVVTLRAAR